MGRRRGYVRQDLVSAALGVFHSRGYKGASTELLVQELGINRNSVYAEFGSKEGLFTAVVDHYQDTVISHIFGPLQGPTATLDEVERLFRVFSETAGGSIGLGCLMCNTAVELGGAVPAFQSYVERYFERIHNAFRNALTGAIRAGQLAPDIDIVTQARFLASCYVGILVLTRSGAPVNTVQGAITGALDHLRRLRDDCRNQNARGGRCTQKRQRLPERGVRRGRARQATS